MTPDENTESGSLMKCAESLDAKGPLGRLILTAFDDTFQPSKPSEPCQQGDRGLTMPEGLAEQFARVAITTLIVDSLHRT